MNYLVDSHVLLWIMLSPKKISKRVRNILLNPELIKHVSAITFWEISLKFSLGKIDLKGILPDQLPTIAKDTGFEILDFDVDIAASFYKLSLKTSFKSEAFKLVYKLPKLPNKDPFDRMLAWQAITKDYCLLTKDTDFIGLENCGLKVIW